MKKAKSINRVRCKYCGRFISNNDLATRNNVKYVFVPDTQFSCESEHFEHEVCGKSCN